MSKQLDWDVVRYVLDDPELDRSAFEQRMLHDESLAWAVADAVESIEQLRIASRFLNKQSLLAELETSRESPVAQTLSASTHATVSNQADRSAATPQSATRGWHWSALAALAAGLLMMIGGSSASLMRWTAQHKHASDESLAMRPVLVSTQALADHWLALDASSESDAQSLELFGEDQDSRWRFGDGNLPSVELRSDLGSDANDDHDWLMEAASLFYAEGAAS